MTMSAKECSRGTASPSQPFIFLCTVLCFVSAVLADDPYRFYTWTATYGTAYPLGAPQQVILINGQFPGPRLDVVTNDNIVLNLINKLNQPLLMTWNGIKQRKNSWQDGVLGTNCPPNSNYTYNFQTKDQIGSFTFFPSTALHRVAGGSGAINIYERPGIPIPFSPPDGDFTLLVGDWFKTDHKTLQQVLDSGKTLPFPDGIFINGQDLKHGDVDLVELPDPGSFDEARRGRRIPPIQNTYTSLDIHVGQSVAVLVTMDQPPKDYYIIASTRFTETTLTVTGVLHYSNSQTSVSGPLPSGPTTDINWSLQQAWTYRWNLTASAARPNPQGSYHYGSITPTKTIILANSAPIINGKQRYVVNGVSFVNPDTPLKLADFYNIPGVFRMDTLPTSPANGSPFIATSVIPTSLHDFVEIVLQNNEGTVQSWHLDGYDFWVAGYGSGQWTPASRKGYNLVDTLTRHTVQVYPNGWTTILLSLDNQGMWNMRSAI